MKKLIIIFTISITLFSCEDAFEYFLDAELESYFQAFEYEAALRHVDITEELAQVSGFIIDIEGAGVVGQCRSYASGDHEVVIDRIRWNNLDAFQKEYLVFHELGHCVLGRSHDNNADESGVCTSIMQSGEQGCILQYAENTRLQLLDELFNY